MNPYLSGVGRAAFGKQPGYDSLDWQCAAAKLALSDAEIDSSEVDTVISGYSTTMSHLMPANLFAERFGIRPHTAFGMSVGGATGLAMVATAARLVSAGAATHVLVVAGENRASGASRTESTKVLAQVGHPDYEVPLGGTVPAYYALLASRYLWTHSLRPPALAPLAVQMRAHAVDTEGAHFRWPITADDVAASRTIAAPLRLLDCCPVSDGGAAFVVSRSPTSARSLRIAGTGQAHRHQHLSALEPGRTGAAEAASRAMTEASVALTDIAAFGIYDSFSITVAMLLEELGLAPPGRAGDYARDGMFAAEGRFPMNTHGGLLSYGHCGVAGGMGHVVEVVSQLRGDRQLDGSRNTGYVHAEGGILSAHVGLVLQSVAR